MVRFRLRCTIQQLILILFIVLFVYHCAPFTKQYLSNESLKIHENFWASNQFLYDSLMKGTKYQTPIFHFKGENDGPVVLIIGGTHGNEPAGFEAAHRLLNQFARENIKKGEIYIIPEANRVSVLTKKRRIPVPKGIDRERGNLNRCYPGDSTGLPMEIAAFEIMQLARDKHIDLLFDLHESPVFHLEYHDKKNQYHGLGQTLIYTPNEKATWLGMVVVDHLNSNIPPGKKQFSLAERPIQYSTAWAAGTHLQIPGFTVETCKKLPWAERIEYQ